MTDQTTPIETASIDELLAAYRDLQAQFDRALDRVRRAEDQKHTVQRRIYDRVRAEYDRELDSIRARMSPVRDELDRMHETLEAQMHDAGSIVQTVEEELSEAEFRHRIGEYASTAFTDLRKTLAERANEARARLSLLQNTIGAIAAMRRPESSHELVPVIEAIPDMVGDEELAPVFDAIPELVPDAETLADVAASLSPEPAPLETPPGPTPDELPRRPVLNAGNIGGATRSGFENPHDWISDVGGEARVERRRPAPAPIPVPPPAPADELDSLLTPVATPAPTPAPGFPSLVFVSGAYVGQAIALLPTSLTIGREHDNNIEIKDPEVARYHARILRERDQYVVEDLNSSTGTWINGERKQRAVITHGDVIRVGQTELALDFEWTTDSR